MNPHQPARRGNECAAHPAPIRVLLVEDHTSYRQAVAMLLSHQPDLTVVADVGTVAEGHVHLTGIDVALLDLDLPDGDGAELIRALHRVNRCADAIVVTASAGRRDLARVVAAGAAGVLHKSTPVIEIIAAIRRAAAGESLISTAELATFLREANEAEVDEKRRAAERAALARLTPREREALAALAMGLGDREIADRLSVGIETARTHMASLISKLGVESRLQVVLLALRHGAVALD